MDTTFFKDLGISGYVGPSGRGTVTGSATGGTSGIQKVVHWCKFSYEHLLTLCFDHLIPTPQ